MKTLTCNILLLSLSIVSWPSQQAAALQRSALSTAQLTDTDTFFLAQLSGELYFAIRSQLWKTDGTPAGTVPLAPESEVANAGTVGCFVPSHDVTPVASNGLLFFSAGDGHGQELWRTNGAPHGTFIVRDIDPQGSSAPHNFTDIEGTMFFETATPCCGIWRSDGTDAGTSFLPEHRLPIGAVNGSLVFERDGELWKSEGTPHGTALLRVLNPAGASRPRALTTHNDQLYFTAFEGSPPDAGFKLWVTDGTSAGTVRLIDTVYPVSVMTCRQGQCYFFGSTDESVEIWRTDGTPQGTRSVAQIGDGVAKDYVDIGGTMYFTTRHGLWRTDGTTLGTGQVLDAGLSVVSQLIAADGALFFVVRDADTFRRLLWKSDGTPSGTILLHDNLGEGRSEPDLASLNGTFVVGIWGPVVATDSLGILTLREWQIYKTNTTQTQLIRVGDLVRAEINCPTPLCACSLRHLVSSSMIVDDKWYVKTADPITFQSKLEVVGNVYFRDVALDHWAFSWVERLADAGLTAGCGAEAFCPQDQVTRDQIAVLLLRGRHGASFIPPPATGTAFEDVPSDWWAAGWIEQLAAEGITGGCEGDNYCPSALVTRAQLAILLLRGKHGAAYAPPAATGSMFSDVPAGYWAASWIEQLAREGLTAGCGTARFCPDNSVSRAELAVFLTRTFDLP